MPKDDLKPQSPPESAKLAGKPSKVQETINKFNKKFQAAEAGNPGVAKHRNGLFAKRSRTPDDVEPCYDFLIDGKKGYRAKPLNVTPKLRAYIDKDYAQPLKNTILDKFFDGKWPTTDPESELKLLNEIATWYSMDNNVPGLKLMIEHGADLAFDTLEGNILTITASNNELKSLAYLLDELKMNPSWRSMSGNTALLSAGLSGHTEAIELLVSKGAQLTERSIAPKQLPLTAGNTVLHKAIHNRNLDLAKFLLDKYPQLLNYRNDAHYGPLHYLFYSLNLKNAQLLGDEKAYRFALFLMEELPEEKRIDPFKRDRGIAPIEVNPYNKSYISSTLSIIDKRTYNASPTLLNYLAKRAFEERNHMDCASLFEQVEFNNHASRHVDGQNLNEIEKPKDFKVTCAL